MPGQVSFHQFSGLCQSQSSLRISSVSVRFHLVVAASGAGCALVTLSHCHTSHHRNTLIVLIAPARHGRHGPFVDNEFPGLTPVTGDEENYQHDQHDHHRGWQHLPQSLENVLPRYYSIRMLEIIWREILLSHFQVKTDLHSPAPASWI